MLFSIMAQPTYMYHALELPVHFIQDIITHFQSHARCEEETRSLGNFKFCVGVDVDELELNTRTGFRGVILIVLSIARHRLDAEPYCTKNYNEIIILDQ